MAAGHTARKPGGRARVVAAGGASTRTPPPPPGLGHPETLGGGGPRHRCQPAPPATVPWEAGPTTHLSLCRKLPVLGEAESEAAEDPGGRRGGLSDAGKAQPTPPHPLLGLQEPRVSSPQLTLDLDPAGAAQEGPGLVPLLHRGQAGAEHLQPQVQHLLARGREGTCSEARAPDLSPPLLRLRLRHHLPQPCWSLSL